MEELSVKSINELSASQKAGFFALVNEYLPGSSQEKMKRYSERFTKGFVAIIKDDEVAGVAFGWLRSVENPDDDSFMLDGIAVRYDYQKQGYGKLLLSAFEKAAADYGAPSVSVGSACGYVERFYIDCGYVPVQYKIWENDAPVIEKVFSGIEDYYAYERKNGEGFVVMEKQISAE